MSAALPPSLTKSRLSDGRPPWPLRPISRPPSSATRPCDHAMERRRLFAVRPRRPRPLPLLPSSYHISSHQLASARDQVATAVREERSRVRQQHEDDTDIIMHLGNLVTDQINAAKIAKADLDASRWETWQAQDVAINIQTERDSAVASSAGEAAVATLEVENLRRQVERNGASAAEQVKKAIDMPERHRDEATAASALDHDALRMQAAHAAVALQALRDQISRDATFAARRARGRVRIAERQGDEAIARMTIYRQVLQIPGPLSCEPFTSTLFMSTIYCRPCHRQRHQR